MNSYYADKHGSTAHTFPASQNGEKQDENGSVMANSTPRAARNYFGEAP